MVTFVASGGITTSGINLYPSLFTIEPLSSILKAPLRENTSVPSGSSILKKPLPVIAISNSLSVCFKEPSEKILLIAVGRTPSPTSIPVGLLVTSLVDVPAYCDTWYIRSANSARDFLNPIVFTFAILFAVVSICVCIDNIPVAAV